MNGLLKNALDVSAVRRDVIANNLVNINTKNFKRYDVEFEKYLDSSIPRVGLKATNSKHFKTDGEFYKVVKDGSTTMRTDGNNVDLDIEKANQAANTLMYNTLISVMNSRFQCFSSVISSK